ncbi:MAG: cupredoxin domain-containing protein [Burkholderiales bacterium]|nr:cupredoxin domain-containing protein [Burkholderiales bacterium]
MDKKVSIIIISAIILSIGIIIFSGSIFKNVTDTQNSVIKDGIQYITIEAKGGYSPRKSTAKAGIPTKLIIKTNDTYDCSLALAIKSLNYQKILSQNGEEIIDIGTPVAGSPLRGVCSMGMYNFVVNFN